MERRHAAVPAVDVVGYSRLMAADETTTPALLKRQRAERLDLKIDGPRVAGPKIAGSSGRIVKQMTACSMAARSMARG